MKDQGECCGNCRFHRPLPETGGAIVLCKRFPPQVSVLGQPRYSEGLMGKKKVGVELTTVEHFPKLDAGQWCGEYQRETATEIKRKAPPRKRPKSSGV